MSALRSWWFWAAGAVLALIVLWRLRRGRRALAGRWSRRTVRLAAILIVAFGGRGPEVAAAPPPDAAPSGLPHPEEKAQEETVRLTPAPLTFLDGGASLRATLSHRYEHGAWRRFVGAVALIEAAPDDHVAELEALSKPNRHAAAWVEPVAAVAHAHLSRGRSPTLKQVEAALLAAEQAGIRDAWLVGLLFRASAPTAAAAPGDGAAIARLYGALERHARVASALDEAGFEAGPVRFRPWMSKAMRPGGDRVDLEVPEGFEKVLRRRLKTADAGAWASEVRWLVTVADGAPEGATLHRGGQTATLRAGDVVALRRLDVVTVPASAQRPLVLRRAGLGSLAVAPGAALTAWNAHLSLDAAARDRLAAWASEAARTGDQSALERLQRELYVAHPAIAAARAETPKRKPGLDMLWMMFSH